MVNVRPVNPMEKDAVIVVKRDLAFVGLIDNSPPVKFKRFVILV
jgi:hypothetical protein